MNDLYHSVLESLKNELRFLYHVVNIANIVNMHVILKDRLLNMLDQRVYTALF